MLRELNAYLEPENYVLWYSYVPDTAGFLTCLERKVSLEKGVCYEASYIYSVAHNVMVGKLDTV